MQLGDQPPRIDQMLEHVEAEDRVEGTLLGDQPLDELLVVEIAEALEVEVRIGRFRAREIDGADPPRAAEALQVRGRCAGSAADVE